MKSVDTHAHVFKRGLKLADVRRYAPGYDVLVDDYLRELDAHAISHGVLVQPSFLGTDNSFMVDALRRHPQRLRGIAMVDPDVSAAELDELADGGVVGIRLNLVGGAAIPDFEAEPWPVLLRNLAQREWQVEVHREARDLPMIVGRLLDAGVNVVVDHMGRPDATLGVDDPGFRYLLSVGATQRIWVKLSGAYRSSAQIAAAAAPLLRRAFGPERLVWGSDWPHTQFEKTVQYAQTRAALDAWVPDPDERGIILGETPVRLFRF
ncbi:MAG: amidohydrolase family protein [Burkholderiales bacterium]